MGPDLTLWMADWQTELFCSKLDALIKEQNSHGWAGRQISSHSQRETDNWTGIHNRQHIQACSIRHLVENIPFYSLGHTCYCSSHVFLWNSDLPDSIIKDGNTGISPEDACSASVPLPGSLNRDCRMAQLQQQQSDSLGVCIGSRNIKSNF